MDIHRTRMTGGGIEEGDYNEWIYKWKWNIPHGLYTNNSTWLAFHIDEVNDIFYLWWFRDTPTKTLFGVYTIADHSTVFEAPEDESYLIVAPHVHAQGDFTFQSSCHSLYYSILHTQQTYILLQRADRFTVEIWRAGALLWSRDVREDTSEATATLRTAEISPTGKYIMVWDDGSTKVMLYEGSKV